MKESTKFLIKKGLLSEGKQNFEISGEFGAVLLNDLLEEYHKEQLAEKSYIPKDPGNKLKVAAEDIKDICRKYDIAGAFALHTPGHGEFVLHLNPTCSSVYMYDDNELRFYSKRKDFNSDEDQLQKQADTCNMLRLLTDLTANNFLMLKQLADKADELTNAIHIKS